MKGSSYNSIGNRITYCRSSLMLTRQALLKDWQEASLPTLVRWECDKIKIPVKKLQSLIAFFNKKGLLVSSSWILNGSDAPPVMIGADEFLEPDFDSLAQEHLMDFNIKISNFTFGQVKNNLMSPYIKYGDYIGGKNIKSEFIKTFKGDMVFIKLDTGLKAGMLSECSSSIILTNFDNVILETFNKESIISLGRIQCIIKRP